MNFYIPKDELITHKHINFSVDLDEDGLLICSTPVSYTHLHSEPFCWRAILCSEISK